MYKGTVAKVSRPQILLVRRARAFFDIRECDYEDERHRVQVAFGEAHHCFCITHIAGLRANHMYAV